MKELQSRVLLEVFRRLGLLTVRTEQKGIVESLLKPDVSIIVPLAYAKSACFQCWPAHCWTSLLQVDGPSIVVVVTPLTALMKKQEVMLYYPDKLINE